MTAAIALSRLSPTATKAVPDTDPALSLRILSRVSPQRETTKAAERATYMEYKTPRVAAPKESNDIVDTTHSKENQVLSLRRKKRAEQSIFVEREG